MSRFYGSLCTERLVKCQNTEGNSISTDITHVSSLRAGALLPLCWSSDASTVLHSIEDISLKILRNGFYHHPLF